LLGVLMSGAGTPAVVRADPVLLDVDVARIRAALVRQAAGAVRWVEIVRAIQARGIDTLVECGPGKVLSGLVKRIDPALTALTVLDPASLQESLGALA